MSRLLTRIADLAVRQLTKTVDPVVKELRAVRLAEAVVKNPLLKNSARHFSQNDEDGILLAILSRIGPKETKCFVEFGIGNGLENNTLILLAHGWRGAWIGGERLSFSTKDTRVSFILDWVTLDNAVRLATTALEQINKKPSDVSVISMDLDGNDFYIVKSLLESGFSPDILIVEYNAKFPPSAAFVIKYDAAHKWAGDDYYGASLKSWHDLLSNKYKIVACNLTGTNAFFVREDYANLFTDIPNSLNDVYISESGALPYSGQKTSVRTVEQIIR